MTTKLIPNHVTGGYTLGGAYTGVVVAYSGRVDGYTPVLAGDGGTGLTLAFAASLTNLGLIDGGAGHPAQFLIKFNEAAGAGGAAVDATPGSTVTDIVGFIIGGQGGAGDAQSGGAAGGAGVHAGAGSTVTDTLGFIQGGQGGAAGTSTYTNSGAGGAGVDLVAGLITLDGGAIAGGEGGASGSGSGAGGAGGAAIVLEAAGTVVSEGTVFGGSGGWAVNYAPGLGGAGVLLAGGGALRQDSSMIVGGYGGVSLGSNIAAGVGGAGVLALASSTIFAGGKIEGGYGGKGGYGAYDVGGQGGAGVWLAAGGVVTVGGLIEGGYSGGVHSATGYGGVGGDGVFLQSGGTLVNAGSIAGGMGRPAYFGGSGGVGVGLRAGGTVINTGAITGGLAQNNAANPNDHSNTGDGLYLLAGGRVINGAPGDSAALISGATGVYALSGGGATVINYGTISGQDFNGHLGAGIEFGAASDRLVVEAGSTVIDGVNGGGGTLELASGKGTISGLGALGTVSVGAALTFAEFGSYVIDAGSSWYLIGTNTVAAGQKMIDAGTLSGSGTLALTGGSVTFNAGAKLAPTRVIMSGASTVTDNVSISFAGKWTQSAGTLSAAAGQSATFTGGADSFAGTLAGAGTVVFAAGADALTAVTLKAAKVDLAGAAVTLSGAIANTSVVSVTAGKLIVAAAGATLTGTGRVSLSDSAANLITGATAASRLTVGQILEGAGNLGGGAMALTNQAAGIIRCEGANALIIDTGAAAIANAGLIESIGTGGVTIVSAVANTGRLFAQASTLTVEGAVTGTGIGQVLNGTLKFTAASVFNQNVTFAAGATGALELAHGQTYAGRITGFSKTGATRLDLDDIAFTPGVTKATYAGTTSSGVLTVTDGTHTAKITLTGDYTTSIFTASSDGHGGTKIVDPTAASIARFVAAAGAFGAVASAPIPLGVEAHATGHSHFLSVPRGSQML